MKRIAPKKDRRLLLWRQQQECRGSLAMATLYRLIARGFAYPERSQIAVIGANLGEIGASLGEIGPLPDGGPQAGALTASLRAVSRAWRMASANTLAREYSRLFLGSGLVPLREGGYGDGLRFAGQPFDIADLNGFYAAFGFALNQNAPSPPDYLGTEAEFLSLLHLKKAIALDKGRPASAQIVDRAMARFLEEHLGRWVGAFDAALREAGAASPYAGLGTVLRRAVAADCARVRVRPRLARPGVAPDPLAKDRLECPFAERAPDRSQAEAAA
jgi:TorA maturation chaperone TorD